MSYSNKIEEAIRAGIRNAIYRHGASYKQMAENSGFKEGTLKVFVNNDCKHLPDERETLFCFIRLASYLLAAHDCDALSRLGVPSTMQIVLMLATNVNGNLTEDILAMLELTGELSVSNKTNDRSKMKALAAKMGETHRIIEKKIKLMQN